MIPRETEIRRVQEETGMARLQAIRHLQQRAFLRTAAPMGSRTRISSDSVWPLKRANGKPWAE